MTFAKKDLLNKDKYKIKTIKTPRKVKDYLEDEMFNRLLKCFDLSKFHEYRDYVITQLIFDTRSEITENV